MNCLKKLKFEFDYKKKKQKDVKTFLIGGFIYVQLNHAAWVLLIIFDFCQIALS